MKVTILEKPKGQTWSKNEMAALTRASIEFQGLGAMPHRLVAMNKPLKSGQTFQQILGHSDFTSEEVDIQDRWN